MAIISAGRHNLFGHPNLDVVRRYQAAGAVVLQTSEVGSVSVRSDGRGVIIETRDRPPLAIGDLLNPRPLALQVVHGHVAEWHTPLLKVLLERREPL